MKQLNLNQLRLVRGAEGSGGGDGVNPPKANVALLDWINSF